MFCFLLFLVTAGCGPKTIQERIVKARQWVEAGKFDKAAGELPELMRQMPTDSAVLMLGCRVYIGLNRPDSVVAYAKKLTALYEKRMDGYQILYQAAGAIDDYKTQLFAITQIGYLENDRPKYYPEIARLNFEMGSFGLGISVCEEMLKTDPENTQARFLLANGLASIGQLDSAIAIMTDLDLKNPGQIEILSNLGSFHVTKQDYPSALGYFQKATELFPDYIPGWFGLGHVRLSLGDTVGAREAYRQVYQHDTTFLGIDSILRSLEPLR
jgi:tetratricopeptide (TPR) repeat protein